MPQDATRLATRCVANYGLSEVGITTYAPVGPGLGFMQKSFEVTVDNIDQDLFGNMLSSGGFQPSDDNWHRIRTAGGRARGRAGSHTLLSPSLFL